MTAQKRKKQKNSNRGGGFFLGSVSFIIICAALIFGMSVFFRVSNIEIVGAEKYTADEIIEVSGIKDGSNLMFINRSAAENRIYSELVYIGTVKITRKLPNTVVINVYESGTVAAIKTDDGYWLIDNNCRLLEKCSASDAESYIKINGLVATEPLLGSTIKASEEDVPKINYLKTILTALRSRNMLDNISSVDISNIANAQFDYLTRFKVKLGKNENIDNKIELLLGVAEKLEAAETGTIDVSEDKKAHFSPYSA